jgi:hypothetical protein
MTDFNAFNAGIISEFRATPARLVGAPMVLITTTGARIGKQRVSRSGGPSLGLLPRAGRKTKRTTRTGRTTKLSIQRGQWRTELLG